MTANVTKLEERLYFGYGSNLWKDQMKKRCPTSTYAGIARLNGYRWIINKRGYANVVETSDTGTGTTNEVWGLVFTLQPHDEDKLDVNEGVPEAYTKEDLVVDFWPATGDESPKVLEKPQRIRMLVYIDRKRLEPDVPKNEYIYRMNMGIRDALQEGMPSIYVDKVIRNFIPDVEDVSVKEYAKRQAVLFEDEN